MKKMMLVTFFTALFTLTGCVDIIHYISFNDKDRTISSVQITFSSAILESDNDTKELKEKIFSITNGIFSKEMDDTNIIESNFIVSNAAVYGFQSSMTAPRHYFAAAGSQDLFPVKESYGFSLMFGDELRKSSKENEMLEELDPEKEILISMMIKYRIFLSRADLPRPLVKAVLTFPKGMEVNVPVTDYGTMYMIDLPFKDLMGQAQKLEFHFAPK